MNYIPFLKVKTGELEAIAALDGAVQREIKPYHLFVDDPNPGRKGEYLETLLRPLVKAHSGRGSGFFVDFSIMNDYEAIHVCERMRERNLNFTFSARNGVLSPNTANYLRDNQLFGNGLAVKIDATARLELQTINDRIQALSQYFGVELGQIDLILDFSYIPFENLGVYAIAFQSMQGGIAGWSQFRNVATIAGSFPRDMNAIPVDTVQLLPMLEHRLFLELLAASDRDLVYGDFGNIHPIYYPEAQGFPGSCTIKYTVENGFKIFRGTLARLVPIGAGQYLEKCRLIVVDPDYDGQDFSYGDRQIYQYAHGLKDGPGSAQTWIINTLNHHLTKLNSLRNQ